MIWVEIIRWGTLGLQLIGLGIQCWFVAEAARRLQFATRANKASDMILDLLISQHEGTGDNDLTSEEN